MSKRGTLWSAARKSAPARPAGLGTFLGRLFIVLFACIVVWAGFRIDNLLVAVGGLFALGLAAHHGWSVESSDEEEE